MVTPDDVESVVCSADAETHRDSIQEFVDAGFDHVYVHQIGPDQEALFRLYEDQLLPHDGLRAGRGLGVRSSRGILRPRG